MAAKPVCVGLVFTHTFDYTRRILRGIRRFVEARPNWLLSFLPDDSQLPDALRRFRPDGVLASVGTKRLARMLSTRRRPVVNTAGVLHRLQLPRVGLDNAEIGRLAAAYFLQRGLRRFAFVGSPALLYSIECEATFRKAVEEAGHAVACYEAKPHPAQNQTGLRWELDPAVRRWLRTLATPVGMFVVNDLWGVQVAEACRQASLRVPDDVAVLGVGDDDLYCEMTRPPLSSIVVPAEQVGYEAAALLERLLDGEKPPREPKLLPPVGVATRRSSEILAIDDEQVVAVVRYIRDNAHQPLRVDDVLRHVPVGRRTLERRFQQALGRSLGDEIRRMHMQRARNLLAETDLPMKVLAERAGFSDCCHMAVVFRKELGLSPTAYRRKMCGPGDLPSRQSSGHARGPQLSPEMPRLSQRVIFE